MRNTILIFCLMFYSSLSIGQNQDKYDAIIDSLSEDDEYEALISYFEKELQHFPGNEMVLRSLGYAHLLNNNPDQGEKYYKDALKVNPTCSMCYINIGRAYSMRGDNKKALELFDKAIVNDPGDADLYSLRAKLKESTGDKLGALSDHNKAVQLEPTKAEYLIERGNYNINQGYSFIALKDMNKAIELSPDNAVAYFQRASIYYGQQQYNEALSDMDRAILLDSTEYDFYVGRGAAYGALRERDKAISDYNKAIGINSDGYLAYYNRALEKYLKEDMDGSCSDILRAYTIMKEKNMEDPLVQEIDYALNTYCDSATPAYYYQRGIAYYNLKQYENAVKIYSKGLKKFPNNSMTLSFRGNAYMALFDYKNAIQDYFSSIANKENLIQDVRSNFKFKDATEKDINLYIKGFSATIQLSIAQSQFSLGQFEEALKEINKGIEIMPAIDSLKPEIYYDLRGNIYLAIAKYEMSIKDFDKSIQLNPTFHLPYINRAAARVNIATQAKTTNYSMSSNINNQVFSPLWTFPAKASAKKSDINLLAALADCEKAIEIEPQSDYAYYMRGRIKKMLNQKDYCYDLLKAKQLGFIIEQEFLNECVK